MKENQRNCPLCGKVIEYRSKYRRNYAEKNGLMCNKCSLRKSFGKKTKSTSRRKSPKIWSRVCPQCNVEIKYSLKFNRDLLQKQNRLCRECGVKKMGNTKQGKHISHLDVWYEQQRKRGEKTRSSVWRCACPRCGKDRIYSRKDIRDSAIKNKSLCNSCSAIVYKKSWSYVIKDEHIKKMSAKKAGYETYSAYMSDLESKKKYFRTVRALTRKQDITTLLNYDKLLENRGLNGVSGAHQLDHIISVSEGYRQNIPPEQIANIDNLQIIPWKDNLLKSNS